MDLFAFLKLLHRQWTTIVLITLATLIAAFFVNSLQPPKFKSTLLYSAGISHETNSEKSFDVTKVADDFAQTVTGWMRSPTFSERVSSLSETSVSASATTQAKQNFLIELFYQDEEGKDKIIAATKQTLEEELKKYNQESKFKFFLTLHGNSSSVTKKSLFFVMSAAALGGLLLSLAWIILSSYLKGSVTSIEEAEKILGTKAAIILNGPSKNKLEPLKILLKRLGHQTLLIVADTKGKQLKKELSDFKTIYLPEDIAKLMKNDNKAIVLVRLDETLTSTLRQTASLSGKELKLAIYE